LSNRCDKVNNHSGREDLKLRFIMRWIVCILFFWGTLAGTAQQPGAPPEEKKPEEKTPSLAELARQARKQRKSSGSTLLFTNADLRSLKNSKIGTSSSASSAGSAETEEEQPEKEEEKPESPEAKNTETDLAQWTALFQQATMDVKNAVNSRMVLELRINNLMNAYYRETDGVRRGFWESEMNKAAAELDEIRKTEQVARDALRELESKAKLEGLLPGQIRKLVGDLPEAKSITEVPVPDQQRDG